MDQLDLALHLRRHLIAELPLVVERNALAGADSGNRSAVTAVSSEYSEHRDEKKKRNLVTHSATLLCKWVAGGAWVRGYAGARGGFRFSAAHPRTLVPPHPTPTFTAIYPLPIPFSH